MSQKRLFSEVDSATNKKQKLVDVELLGSDLTVLEKFVQLFEAGDLEDVYVENALSNPTVLGILGFLDSGAVRKSSELTTVFKALYMLILIGSREKSSKLTAVVHELAEGVLEDLRFASCLRGLQKKQGAEANKAVLRLLAVVATVSTNLARGLLRSLPFSSPEMIQCSRRRNTAEEQDARSCFLNLVAAFVFSENNLVIREAIEKRDPFVMVINESYIDKYTNVMLILEMLIKITENKTISKTHKVRLFDRNSLKQLLYLYSWRGEAVTLQDLAGRGEDYVEANQLDSVRKKLHQLLILLTTSTRFGLVFSGCNRDWRSPANDLIFHALISPPMCPAYNDPLRFELVLSALFACPDILAPYLDSVAPLLYPRPDSLNWFRLMSLICGIYDQCRVNVIKWAMMAIARSTLPQQAALIIVDCLFLSPKMVEPMTAALQYKESTKVVTASEELMSKLQSNLIILLTWLSLTDQFPTTAYGVASLRRELRLLFRERMPTTEHVNQFDALFGQQFNDPQVLHDQTFLNDKETDNPDAGPKDVESPKVTRSAEDDLTELEQLPKKFSKTLVTLYKSLIGLDISDSRLHKAMAKLPGILEQCVQEYFHSGVVLRCLSQFLRLQQSKSFTEVSVKPKRLFRWLFTHPQFPSVLHPDWLSQSTVPDGQGESADSDQSFLRILDSRQYLRDCLVELLLILIRHSPKLGLKNLQPLWLLRAYSATTSLRDHNILELLFLMESKSPGLLTGTDNLNSVPLVWGPTVGQHYRFPEDKTNTVSLKPVLLHQPTLGALFHCIDADQLRVSSTQFPLTHKWLTQSPTAPNALPVTFDSGSDTNVHDPCFLLHVFHHYLDLYRTSLSTTAAVAPSTQSEQFLRTFYSRSCLAYSVAALSSYSKHIRTMARSLIADYRDLAEQWRPPRVIRQADSHTNLSLQLFPERSKIIFILDTLRNSLSTGGGITLGGASRKKTMFHSKADTGGRLTRLHANFFVLTLQLLSKPEHHMYQTLWNCLLSKPALNLNQVPDFLRCFFSTDTHFREERSWISRLCASSIADGADYLVLERSRVFKHMLTTYSSPSCDTTFQLTVLHLIHSATSQPRLMHALIRFHALPLWLWRHALQPCSLQQVELFRAILDNILTALSTKEVDSPIRLLIQLMKTEFERVQSENTKPANPLSLIHRV
ncbi:hypothetical protein D915_003745 [Fasciola hepatica]|uniref:Nucleolar pre-ribosomal-associated protein 1 n=1 Tax=Fasciola hepatica TaxID=6192 RepID=A0A4E0S256_FASHE|nr:hypothetical protein D915_003745 [Fasciola hepatica]